MDNTPENQDDAPALEPADATSSNYESLAQFVISILILVIVISGTLNILLARLWKNSKSDVDAIRPQYNAFRADFESKQEPHIDRITKGLQAYGATNPDYVPILTNFGFRPMAAPPGAAAPKK
jgi:hypothetical protein